MSLGDHLEDLRRRVILSLVGLLPIFIAALIFGTGLLGIIIRPAQQALRARGLPAALQVTGPLEMFSAYVRVAVVLTVLVGSPWILWQIWKFIAPGLYRHERRFVQILGPLSAALTVSAGLFLYYIMLPVVLLFFIGFGSSIGVGSVDIAPPPTDTTFSTAPLLTADPPDPTPGEFWINTDRMEFRLAIDDRGSTSVRAIPLTSGTGVAQQYRVMEYVKLVFSLGLAFGVGFQMPVVILLLGWVGLVERSFLTRYRRYAVLGCAVVSAILTPADPVSMLLLLVPLFLLYELGILLLRVVPAERLAPEGDTDDEADSGDEADRDLDADAANADTNDEDRSS
ncbi:MAG: twin-arginine translocase subunit TatC [Planctomycetota bacterium]